MEPCSVSTESGDGRASFSLSPSGQLKMPQVGNYCVTFAGDGAARAVVQDCVEAEDNTDTRDKFFMHALLSLDMGVRNFFVHNIFPGWGCLSLIPVQPRPQNKAHRFCTPHSRV
jgi:hypothetical protein